MTAEYLSKNETATYKSSAAHDLALLECKYGDHYRLVESKKMMFTILKSPKLTQRDVDIVYHLFLRLEDQGLAVPDVQFTTPNQLLQ